MAGNRESESGQADDGQEESIITEARRELARVVGARIKELGLTREEIKKRSGVSVATLREIEHPTKPREFRRSTLEPLSIALEWPPDHLARFYYRSSSEQPDPVIQEMMTALAPYLEKINAIPGLQKDVMTIKDSLIKLNIIPQAE